MSDGFTEDDLRKALFIPCENREDLHEWILCFLGLDIPDQLVDPDSTASPMDVIWEVYQAAKDNDRPDLSRLLAYAARDAYKTVLAAVLEVLVVLHLDRNVAHMAAIEGQAYKAQRYVKDYFAKPFLRDYVTTQNERRTEIVRYTDPATGNSYTQAQFDELPVATRDQLRRHNNYIQIVIATIAGANSEHVSFMVIDEVDVIQNPKAYEEAKFIASPYEGKTPITLLISTRKTSTGLVQQEIDEAAKTRLQIRHWNIIDVTERCPTSRHKPDDPRVTLYRSDEELRHVSEEEYQLLDVKVQQKFARQEGAYGGCAKCPLFAMCKGNLATKQKVEETESKLLKPITHVINLFGVADLDSAQAQLMSRKAASTGLVYPRFDRQIHMLTAQQMASKILGEQAPQTIDKAGLISLMMAQGLNFYGGSDWGFTHNYVLVSGAQQGLNLYIFDVISQAGLDPEEKLAVSEKVKLWNPTIFADPEAPDQIKFFKKKGFQMRDWKKTPGSVKMGIDVVRTKMRPAVGDPQLYLLKDDLLCELLATRLSKYHFKLDAAGEVTDIPDETNDDECDACRYLVMNIFAPKAKLTATDGTTISTSPQPIQQPTVDNYLNYFINQNIGNAGEAAADPATKKGKKGKIYWSF